MTDPKGGPGVSGDPGVATPVGISRDNGPLRTELPQPEAQPVATGLPPVTGETGLPAATTSPPASEGAAMQTALGEIADAAEVPPKQVDALRPVAAPEAPANTGQMIEEGKLGGLEDHVAGNAGRSDGPVAKETDEPPAAGQSDEPQEASAVTPQEEEVMDQPPVVPPPPGVQPSPPGNPIAAPPGEPLVTAAEPPAQLVSEPPAVVTEPVATPAAIPVPEPAPVAETKLAPAPIAVPEALVSQPQVMPDQAVAVGPNGVEQTSEAENPTQYVDRFLDRNFIEEAGGPDKEVRGVIGRSVFKSLRVQDFVRNSRADGSMTDPELKRLIKGTVDSQTNQTEIGPAAAGGGA